MKQPRYIVFHKLQQGCIL